MNTKRMTTLAAAAALIALPGCGSSSPPKEHGGSSSARTPEEIAQAAPYRIAGAGLMMTPDQIAAALRAEGYQPSRDSEQFAPVWSTDSFEDQVQYRLSGHAPVHPRRVPTHQEWSKGHETVTVGYAVYPGDAKAIGIDWKTDDGSPSEAEIRSTLTKRYGPGFQLKSFLPPQWCSPAPCSPNSAVLTASTSGIGLSAPNVLGQPISFNQRMDAAVRAHDGASKGSF